MIRLEEISFQNLRGYETASLSLESDYLTIVGNNNQGKSSALFLLDFILNTADMDVLTGRRRLSKEESGLLLPANDARHQARRIALKVSFADKRRERRYLVHGEDTVLLRISVQVQERKLRLNLGTPRKAETADSKALELLYRLRRSIGFFLIPSERYPGSPWFKKFFTEELTHILREKTTHHGQGGTTKDYRDMLGATTNIKRLGTQFSTSLWKELYKNLPPALLKEGQINLPVSNDTLIAWLAEMAQLRISTGKHDANFVDVGSVGAGLQSLVGIALGLHVAFRRPQAKKIIAIEEPEENLHPGAQRAAAALLRQISARPRSKVIITTHSPYFLEEARYGETVIARNRKYYHPVHVGRKRSEINTVFMNVSSAEIFFSNRVLFVEGQGDKVVFDTLIRRLRMLDAGRRLWELTVREVGGKNSCAPWIQLLQCYGSTDNRPIRWMILFDADAASSALVRCLQDCDYTLDPKVQAQCQALINSPIIDVQQRMIEAERLNRLIYDFNMQVFSIDLEWALTHASAGKQSTALSIWNSILASENIPAMSNPADIARRLGSKLGAGNGLKQPHLRFKFAQSVPFAYLPDEIEGMLQKILNKFYSKKYVDTLLNEAKRLNPMLPR